ncbi:MAG: hypothetical protein F4Y14_15745 [Acidobacteria bacterium]|nr:hypothetical protein [Acidobacteriota bacterium]
MDGGVAGLGGTRLHAARAGGGVAPGGTGPLPVGRDPQPMGNACRETRTMSAERLQLPEPAGTLWTRVREPLKRALESLGAPMELKLGGGTVLAARWKHRSSHDIDIVVPEKTNLWTYGAALDDAMTALGADKYGYSPKHKQYRAAFTEGSTRQTLDIWPNDPEPRGAERAAEIDRVNEVVLATAQILKGKLERGEDALARDVIDVITAERLDPAGLEVAVNAVTPPYARLVGAVWDRAQTTIARRAEAEFGDTIADPATLGPRAGEAILSRMYARIAVAVEDGRIVATTTTDGGTMRRREWTAGEAAERFVTSGLDAALSGMRQDAARIRDAATASAQAGRNQQIADCRNTSA